MADNPTSGNEYGQMSGSFQSGLSQHSQHGSQTSAQSTRPGVQERGRNQIIFHPFGGLNKMSCCSDYVYQETYRYFCELQQAEQAVEILRERHERHMATYRQAIAAQFQTHSPSPARLQSISSPQMEFLPMPSPRQSSVSVDTGSKRQGNMAVLPLGPARNAPAPAQNPQATSSSANMQPQISSAQNPMQAPTGWGGWRNQGEPQGQHAAPNVAPPRGNPLYQRGLQHGHQGKNPGSGFQPFSGTQK